MTTSKDIRIICEDGGLHEDRGPRNIITMRKLSSPGLDGASWREVPVETDRKLAPNEPVLNAERGRRETVLTPAGERLTGVFAGRTRSAMAAQAAGYDPDALRGSILHFDLQCPTCGLDPAPSSKDLDRILDHLHTAGQTQVTLKLIELALHSLHR